MRGVQPFLSLQLRAAVLPAHSLQRVLTCHFENARGGDGGSGEGGGEGRGGEGEGRGEWVVESSGSE